jgi:hypothetical protein
MIQKEVAFIILMINKAYPKSNVGEDDKTVNLWQAMLGDIPFNVAEIALKRLIATSPYPPTIADIRRNVTEAVMVHTETAEEAWTKVVSAVGMYGHGNGDKVKAYIGVMAWKAVSALYGSWEGYCMADTGDTMTARAHFFKIYNAYLEREKNKIQIPASVREGMDKLAGHDMKELT